MPSACGEPGGREGLKRSCKKCEGAAGGTQLVFAQPQIVPLRGESLRGDQDKSSALCLEEQEFVQPGGGAWGRLGAHGRVKYNQSFLDGRTTLPVMRVCKFFA